MFPFIDWPASSRYSLSLRIVSATVFAMAVVHLSPAVAHDSSGPIQYLLNDGGPAAVAAPTHEPTAPAGRRPQAVAAGHREARTVTYHRRDVAQAKQWVPPSPHASTHSSPHAPPAPVQVAAVSVYEDKTLRRGDAVMTPQGLRVFNGSKAFPYRVSDFSTLASTPSLGKRARANLTAYDQAPLRQHVEVELVAMTIHLHPGQ